MKRLALTLSVVLVVALFWAMLPSDDQVFAGSGCCKARQSKNDPWQKIGTDLNQCAELNQADNDNVLQPSGLVWWDAAC
ncbi:MAG: hypothetical protein ACE5NW_12585 [Acidiferrobacterales bacterium]